MKREPWRKAGESRRCSRRSILAGAAVAAISSPLVIPLSALGRGGQLAPSERITIGMLGVGNRGSSALRAMGPLPDHQVVAIADPRRQRALLAQEQANGFYAGRLGKQKFAGCEIYNDFRDVLARDDIDAVWGCAPDHWHGPLYIRAIEAGKDVYGEKPLTRWIAQGIKIREAVRQYGCVFQTGTQQRSHRNFRRACELVRNGYLGKVHTIHVVAPAGESCPAVPPCDPPEGFDYDMWTGPAPYLPFDAKRCEWMAMYMISHYCAGFITNWGVHYLDIAGWGCPEVFDKPLEIDGTGVLPSEGMTDTWISWQLELRWESGLKLIYTSDPKQQGCKFVGNQGWVHVNRRDGISAEPASLLSVRLDAHDGRLHASPQYADYYTAHTADFFRSIRTRQDPVSPVEAGHRATTLGNVADIALRLSRKLKWDPSSERFVGDDVANNMLSRATRSPWTV
jgi:predicted dehydrogenase